MLFTEIYGKCMTKLLPCWLYWNGLPKISNQQDGLIIGSLAPKHLWPKVPKNFRFGGKKLGSVGFPETPIVFSAWRLHFWHTLCYKTTDEDHIHTHIRGWNNNVITKMIQLVLIWRVATLPVPIKFCLLLIAQGSYGSWKMLKFIFWFFGPGKSWIRTRCWRSREI